MVLLASGVIYKKKMRNTYVQSLCHDRQTYKGYRVFAVDGTTVNMARNSKSNSFMRGRMEYEANIFVAQISLPDDEILDYIEHGYDV